MGPVVDHIVAVKERAVAHEGCARARVVPLYATREPVPAEVSMVKGAREIQRQWSVSMFEGGVEVMMPSLCAARTGTCGSEWVIVC